MICFTVNNMISFETNQLTLIPTIEVVSSKTCVQVMFKFLSFVWNRCYVRGVKK